MTTIAKDFDFLYLESLDEIKDLHNILNRIDNRFSDFLVHLWKVLNKGLGRNCQTKMMIC